MRTVARSSCRFVSARNGTIKIAETVLTTGAIINGGADVTLVKTVFCPRVIINANEHVFKKSAH